MEQIFSVTTNIGLLDFDKVNKYLKDNPNATVKSVTPITQHGQDTMRYYGVVIVIEDKNI